MRIVLVILASATFLCAKAQSHLPVGTGGYPYPLWQPLPLYSGIGVGNPNRGQKWQLIPSAGLSAGYIFLNRGISYVSAPLSLTLYHPLTNNVTAFAGVIAAPTMFSVGSLYSPSPLNQPFSGNNFAPGYGLGINAGIQGGLIYTNDAHTFSISGSVIMQRGSYPVYPSRSTDNPKH